MDDEVIRRGRCVELLDAGIWYGLLSILIFSHCHNYDSLLINVIISGAGIMVTGSSSSSSTGQNVIIGGLFVQIIFFGFFLISALVFQQRIRADSAASAVADQYPWRKHMWALHSSSILVLIRSVVRVVEYIQGTYGYVMGHEAFIYVFDGLLMFALMVIFVVIHPSEVNYLLGRGRAVVRMGGLKVEADVMA
jgi:hypothetical protein